MLAIQSQRRFLDPPERFIVKDSLYGYEEEKSMHKSITVQVEGCNKYIHIPIYLYGSLTELVKVDLGRQQVKAKLTLYATVLVNLTQEHLQQLKAHGVAGISGQERISNIDEQIDKLHQFICNNLIIQCGDKVIDVINQEQQQNAEEQSDSESFESEEDEQQIDDFICKKVKSHSSCPNTVTYQIQSVINCDLSLNSILFPYLNINCSLRIRARSQYYKDFIIKYKMLSFSNSDQYSIKQFSSQFLYPSHQKFGIYSVNTSIDSFMVKPVERSMVSFDKEQIYSLTRYLQFRFEVYSFNIPFILRNLVPVLVLCFVSLICYLAEAEAIWDVYGNVILLMITLIQLLSNFSSSKFNTSKLNLFQANLFGIIIINVLLAIIATSNFYNQDVSIANLNSKNAFFWISVAIGVFFIVSNVVILTFLGFKIKSYSPDRYDQQRHITNYWLWNEELFENFIDDIDGTLRRISSNQ